MKPERVRLLKVGRRRQGPVVYWMSRDQRIFDNWALIFAQSLALRDGVPLAIAFTLAPSFLGATNRQYHFMLSGLFQLKKSLNDLDIPFFLLKGDPISTMVSFAEEYGIGALVTDFDPLREKGNWKTTVMEAIEAYFYEVDAHNVVPCWAASQKQEYAARTFRPRLHRYLPLYFEEFPNIIRHPTTWTGDVEGFTIEGTMGWLKADAEVKEVRWIRPGEASARVALENFIVKRLNEYSMTRNDPSVNGQSDLSPYLHFGQLSAQRVALRIVNCQCHKVSAEAFLEELLVRRELSDNYCYYNSNYDRFEGSPQWAKKTLEEHLGDRREYLYSLQELEDAKTHDTLWNAAQREMIKTGKMHGYLRMYWAKKILEWSESPQEAIRTAILLNDRYELDGRDPNGFVGVAWSIVGLHDRPWRERPIFGKIRYMSRKGMDAKFNTSAYIKKHFDS